MDASLLIRELEGLKDKTAAGPQATDRWARCGDLKKAISMADAQVPVQVVRQPGEGTLRLHDGHQVVEVPLVGLKVHHFELDIYAAVSIGDRVVAVVESGPGEPAQVCLIKISSVELGYPIRCVFEVQIPPQTLHPLQSTETA